MNIIQYRVFLRYCMVVCTIFRIIGCYAAAIVGKLQQVIALTFNVVTHIVYREHGNILWTSNYSQHGIVYYERKNVISI